MERKSIFESKEHYAQFIQNWKQSCNLESNDTLTFQHFIIYALLRGKDWNICIAPTSKDSTKYDAEHWAMKCKFKYLSMWPFGDTITEEMLEQARANYKERV